MKPIAPKAIETAASLEAKRQAAIAYLRERHIYRGDLNCNHTYSPAGRTPSLQPRNS